MIEREPDARTVLTRHRLLGARLTLHAKFRFAAAALIAVGAIFARTVLRIETLDVVALSWLALAVVTYNGVAIIVARSHREPDTDPAVGRRLRRTMHGMIGLDFLALTTAVWLVGGARSPFLAFYLLHVILSCLLLPRRDAIAISALAYVLMAILVTGEWLGLIPPRLPIGAVADMAPFDWRFVVTILTVYGVLMSVIVSLVTSLSARLRAEEEHLVAENVELDRRSNLRRDFLHLALHDIQSMVGVVAANLRNMAAGLGGPLNEKHEAWVASSLRRLDGINQFLKEFRILESLESAPIRSQLRAVGLHALLEELVAAHRDLADAHHHAIELEASPSLSAVPAIPELLREAIANYLTNAIKYTPDGGRIVLRAFRQEQVVRVEVEDTGIGIAPEEIHKLFHEFVRLDCSDTPVAGARGTGLGLSIVRRIVERMGGTTGVRSTLGVGSTFYLELPAGNGLPRRLADPEAIPPAVTPVRQT